MSQFLKKGMYLVSLLLNCQASLVLRSPDSKFLPQPTFSSKQQPTETNARKIKKKFKPNSQLQNETTLNLSDLVKLD